MHGFAAQTRDRVFQTTLFQCSKNFGSPTSVTRLKVAPNMADPISFNEKRL